MTDHGIISLQRTELATKASAIAEARNRIATLESVHLGHGKSLSSISNDFSAASKDLKGASRVQGELATELREWTDRNVLLQVELEDMKRAVKIAGEDAEKATYRWALASMAQTRDST